MPSLAVLPGNRRLAAADTVLPPGVTPAGTRGVILNVALRLFAERGFGASSIRDIAKLSGVQPASIYAHYPSKEHVLAEITRIGHEEHHLRLRTALLECAPDARQQLIALVKAHVGLHATYSMLAVVANAELHALSGEFAGASLELRRQSEQLIWDVVERGARLGSFDVPDTWLAVAAIGGMGLRVSHWYTPDCGLSVEQVAEQYAEFACRIVGAGTPAGT
ncbi:MAG: TetR/AcrR family transcriptional regulator [Nevskia sp.]|nr:TetR/AcrR family transcriptional regulator [Nevskia sp.]